MDDDQEAEAIRRVLSGDTEAFRALVEHYERPILSMTRVLNGTWYSAEDVAQEVFVSVLRISVLTARGDPVSRRGYLR